jgi:NAD(P)-dependent dehydrogenase (short-subunit alcohol dehydrogenase family)
MAEAVSRGDEIAMPYAPFDLSGKVALITGGNSGIGLGMAEALAQAGAAVCVWGTNEEKNAQATAHLRQFTEAVQALRCDVGDEEQVEAAVAATLERFGRIDGCFANAGVGSRGLPFHETPTEDWHRVTRINLEGVFFTFRAVLRHMIARDGGGTLVGTASGTAIMGAPRSQAYAATKGGLRSMMLGLALEYGRHGITANTIIPGWIETPMTERRFQDERFATNVLKRITFRRWGTPRDFGGIAVYLMSDAARYHTGDTIIIDGGLSKS